MKQLSTIQKRERLNNVYVVDDPHPVNKGHHEYVISHPQVATLNTQIKFQNGPRREPDSITGVLDTDLLEIVRHRLQSFQEGPYATRENAIALTHIEEALMWMNKRVEDRIEREVLGTNNL